MEPLGIVFLSLEKTTGRDDFPLYLTLDGETEKSFSYFRTICQYRRWQMGDMKRSINYEAYHILNMCEVIYFLIITLV